MKSLFTIALCLAGLTGGGDEKQKPELRLKPTVAARSLDVMIGELCEVTPADGTTLALAQLRFGPAPTQGHARTVTRTDLIQSLAAAGIRLDTVRITGADEAVVQAVTTDVPVPEMIDAATAALQAQLAVEGGDGEFEAPNNVRRVQAPPGRVSQELRARVRNTRTGPNAAIVDVEILVDGEVSRKVPLTFALRRYHRVLKTIGTIAAGTPLGPENLALVREPMDQVTGLFLDRIDQIDGLIAARNLQPDRRLTLGDAIPPAVVRRGDVVTVVLTRGRVKVTTKALANHDAPLAGRITLTNMQSRATLTGVVHGPGLVVVPN
jgi:flagellar basal body P-ring formation protein FlgA